ncbi:uncharacterized protein [Rutidosis leptorrhynchoides]|uniref:uncharacterized protein n=1 Tax=Rutidosis leptorrhynchoides TaxID=125765 RepID=UPI003A9A628C
MWDSLNSILNISGVSWVICGDFNEVRNSSERLNCQFIENRAKMFNEFINQNMLVDIPMGGRKFTRVSDDGVKMRKLDRFLVLGDFLNLWSGLKVIALDRLKSDHCPIMLSDGEVNFGPKPFKVFDDWFHVEDVDQVIAESWSAPLEGNRKDCVFRNKLKRLKEALKIWSQTHFGNLDVEIENAKREATNLELKAESGSLDSVEYENWMKSRKLWLDKEKIKCRMLKQKARVRWMIEGDENSKYFHNSLRRNYNKTNIRGVSVNGAWCVDPVTIKEAAASHFQTLFSEVGNERPSLDGLSYMSISEQEATDLELPFSEAEVRESVNCCGSSKAPGPDGFNLGFF